MVLRHTAIDFLVTIEGVNWTTMRICRLILLSAGLLFCVFTAVHAAQQSYDGIQIDELKRVQAVQNTQVQVNDQRLTTVERAIRETRAERINDRVIRLEGIAETLKELLIAMAIAMGGLLIEAIHRMAGNLKRRAAEL